MNFASRAKKVTLLSIFVTLLSIAGGGTVISQQPQKPSREEIANRSARLLARAPVLNPLPADALTEREFMDEVERLLDEDVDNVGEAIRELEEQLKPKGRPPAVIRYFGKFASLIVGDDDSQKVIAAVDPVIADVESVPSNLPVRYYRQSRPKQKLDTTTNKPNLELDPPAIWVFECTNRGVQQTKVVPCTTGCSVRFVF